VRLGRTYKREYKVISTYTNSKKMVSASWTKMVHRQTTSKSNS
jgi:hypothetical protein